MVTRIKVIVVKMVKKSWDVFDGEILNIGLTWFWMGEEKGAEDDSEVFWPDLSNRESSFTEMLPLVGVRLEKWEKRSTWNDASQPKYWLSQNQSD